MAFTAQLGIADSYPSNIELGLGSVRTVFNLYSGIYKFVDGKMNDTLVTSINYPDYTAITIAMPVPFIETAPISDQVQNNPLNLPKL